MKNTRPKLLVRRKKRNLFDEKNLASVEFDTRRGRRRK